MWSRRLTEPPRPANVGLEPSNKVSEPKGWRGRSESCQTGSVHRLASAEAKFSLPPPAERGGYSRSEWWRIPLPPRQRTPQQRGLSSVMRGASCKAFPERGGTRHRRAEGFVSQRRKVAAALSAAVTSAKLIGDTPTLQAEPSQKKRPNSNASRSSGERGLGGEALLSEKRPLPPESSPKFVSLLAKTGK